MYYCLDFEKNKLFKIKLKIFCEPSQLKRAHSKQKWFKVPGFLTILMKVTSFLIILMKIPGFLF